MYSVSSAEWCLQATIWARWTTWSWLPRHMTVWPFAYYNTKHGRVALYMYCRFSTILWAFILALCGCLTQEQRPNQTFCSIEKLSNTASTILPSAFPQRHPKCQISYMASTIVYWYLHCIHTCNTNMQWANNLPSCCLLHCFYSLVQP